jgi:hypothetical protein
MSYPTLYSRLSPAEGRLGTSNGRLQMYVVDFVVTPMHAFMSSVPSVRNRRSPCSLHVKVHEILTERSLPNASTRLDILEEFWQEPTRQWGCIRMSHAGTGPAWEVACASACASAAACTEEVASMDFREDQFFLLLRHGSRVGGHMPTERILLYACTCAS